MQILGSIQIKNRGKTYFILPFIFLLIFFSNRTIRSYTVMEQHKTHINKPENESRYIPLEKKNTLSISLTVNSTLIHVHSQAVKMLLIKQRMELISIVRLTLDLVHAGSTLPKGMLWGGKFESWHVGLIGTISSFIGLYQYFAKKRIISKSTQWIMSVTEKNETVNVRFYCLEQINQFRITYSMGSECHHAFPVEIMHGN